MKLFRFPENGVEHTLKCSFKAQIPIISKPKYAFSGKWNSFIFVTPEQRQQLAVEEVEEDEIYEED